jgi:hypothetical protein
LREWANANIRIEHRAAVKKSFNSHFHIIVFCISQTVLNPRLRHLPLICSDTERAAVYQRIRELIGLSKPKRETGVGTSMDGPAKSMDRILNYNFFYWFGKSFSVVAFPN